MQRYKEFHSIYLAKLQILLIFSKIEVVVLYVSQKILPLILGNKWEDNHEIPSKENLIKQLTAPVRWTQISLAMVEDGATTFIEVGPGTVLQGLIKKVKADGEFISASI